ncbi:MAG: type II toxin-antitoxin system YoeB family toxin [Selenomonadaceae bacterium]|nr:type II toxin-antitoxin system YoeB family toxin [Selenomonadaceae bacterium]
MYCKKYRLMGKPEKLNYRKNAYSRRIDQANRLV